jgi:hypothetical protein
MRALTFGPQPHDSSHLTMTTKTSIRISMLPVRTGWSIAAARVESRNFVNAFKPHPAQGCFPMTD